MAKENGDDLKPFEVGIGLLVAALGIAFILFSLNMCDFSPDPEVVVVERVITVEPTPESGDDKSDADESNKTPEQDSSDEPDADANAKAEADENAAKDDADSNQMAPANVEPSAPQQPVQEAEPAKPVQKPQINTTPAKEIKPLDSDGDGVNDSDDRCSNTKANVKVETNGCEVDADADGVSDSTDKCPQTTQGVEVDGDGCEVMQIGKDGLNAFGQKIGDLFTLDLPNGSEIEVPKGGFEESLAEDLASDDQKEVRRIFDRIYFDSGSYALDTASSDQIKATATIINAYNIPSILIRGHTDSTGQTAANYQLSLQRAEAVKQALINDGVTAEIKVEGRGEVEPADSNETEEGRRNNRRIDITVLR